MTEMRELQISHETDAALLKYFYEDCYMAQFPDADERESLANIENYLHKKEAGGYGLNNYHVLIALDDDKPIGGSISDYFVEPNAGVIEFILIQPGLRKTGMGGHLLEETEHTLELDAENSLHQPLDWIVGEIEDPYLTPFDTNTFDLFTRARIWHRWGYRMLDFPYIQPALSGQQSPLYNLKLMTKTLTARFRESIPTVDIRNLLTNYLNLAMRIPEPTKNVEFQKMDEFLSRRSTADLIPFSDYIGWAKQAHMDVNEVHGLNDPELDQALRVYEEMFTNPETAIDSDAFRKYFQPDELIRLPGCYLHLWTIRREGAKTCEGMASFMTMPSAGFGGYLGFLPPLRGSGKLGHLLRRIEERMVRDCTHARGWYIECDGDLERDIFTKKEIGFHELDVEYMQPPLCKGGVDRPIHLLYKPFGAVYEPPTIEVSAFLDAIREVYHCIYSIPYEELDSNELFVALRDSVKATPTVKFKSSGV